MDTQIIDSNLDTVQDAILQGLGELAEYIGLNRTQGHIYGVLLFNDGPLSLEEIAQKVNKSKASISSYTRLMEHLGLIRCVTRMDPDRERRQKYYEAESNLKLVAGDIAQRKYNELVHIRAIFQEGLVTLNQHEGENIAGFPIILQRVENLQATMGLMEAVINNMVEALAENNTP